MLNYPWNIIFALAGGLLLGLFLGAALIRRDYREIIQSHNRIVRHKDRSIHSLEETVRVQEVIIESKCQTIEALTQGLHERDEVIKSVSEMFGNTFNRIVNWKEDSDDLLPK